MRVLVWSRGDSEWFLKGTGGCVWWIGRAVDARCWVWIAMGRLVGCARGSSRGVLVIAGEREDSRRGAGHALPCTVRPVCRR